MEDIVEGRCGQQPDWILFPHDWAAYMPKIGFNDTDKNKIAEHDTVAEADHHETEMEAVMRMRREREDSTPPAAAALATDKVRRRVAGTSSVQDQHECEQSVADLFSSFYPHTPGFGVPGSFSLRCPPPPFNQIMSGKVTELFDIPTIVVENYIGRPDGGFIHLNVALLLLMKQAGAGTAVEGGGGCLACRTELWWI
jgi:hypothetical protein